MFSSGGTQQYVLPLPKVQGTILTLHHCAHALTECAVGSPFCCSVWGTLSPTSIPFSAQYSCSGWLTYSPLLSVHGVPTCLLLPILRNQSTKSLLYFKVATPMKIDPFDPG